MKLDNKEGEEIPNCIVYITSGFPWNTFSSVIITLLPGKGKPFWRNHDNTWLEMVWLEATCHLEVWLVTIWHLANTFLLYIFYWEIQLTHMLTEFFWISLLEFFQVENRHIQISKSCFWALWRIAHTQKISFVLQPSTKTIQKECV